MLEEGEVVWMRTASENLSRLHAAVLAMPTNISFAYCGYKLFVFRTKGNYLREWFKCFAVYGTGMIPGLVVLSALTRFLQSMIRHHAVPLHHWLDLWESNLSGHPMASLQRLATDHAAAGVYRRSDRNWDIDHLQLRRPQESYVSKQVSGEIRI